ncbi:hypothetical protein V5735_15635 (plasmid) [Haladaptatus sp. SPP-AMP-3]|uniref:hypothetical protein n=1 Tax=Haladaptatus sp. SPP-AMP-3 TaxID=3121295 RepID=UPI003C2DFFCC
MNEILKPLCLVLLLLLAGCNGTTTGPSSTTHAPTSRTTVDTVVSNRTTSTTTLPTKTCTVANETKDGSIVAVRPTMHRDREVIVMTQWNATANVSKLDVTLDSSRLFEARSSVLDGENVSGFGRPVGTAPLAGQLQVELYDHGRRIGQYNASMVCER